MANDNEAASTSRAASTTTTTTEPNALAATTTTTTTLTPFSGTSCIVNAKDEALWFSKNILPAIRKEAQLRESDPLSPVWRHIGLYGYKRDALERFVSLPEGQYERVEGLEQLRFLKNGMRIQAVKVAAAPSAMWGIDTPEDAAHAEKLIAGHGKPLAEFGG